MAVAPDLLLTTAPSGKPAAALSRPPHNTAHAAQDKGSSFADVYARENRPAAPERPAHASRAARERPRDTQPEPAAADRTAAAEQPKVADDGKDLPAASEDKPETTDTTAQDQAGAQAVAPEQASQVLANLGMFPQNGDSDLENLNQANALDLEGGQSVQLQQDGNARGKLDLSALQLNAAQPQVAEGEGGEGELQLAASLFRLPEKAADTKLEGRSETFAARLDSLTQALNSPSALSQRPVNPLLPGQPVPLQHGGMSEALVDRVMWMSSQNLKSADIQMEPADLGRLEVRIHMSPDQTQITFASANAGVRDAVESQLHRLRDMFGQQGMTSLDVNVSDQSLSRGWQGQQGEGRGGSGRVVEDGEEPVRGGVMEVRSQPGRMGRGLVDYFA